MSRDRISLAVLAAALLALFWFAPNVPFIALVAVLLAVGIRALADPLARRLRLPDAVSVPAVLLLLIGAAAAAGYVAAGPLLAQGEELFQRLPGSARELEERMRAAGWSRWLLDTLPDDPLGELAPQEVLQGGRSAARAALGLAGGVFGGLGSAVFTLLLAIYLAFQPALYRAGLEALLAPGLRPRGREILEEAGRTLRWWLAGQLFSMAFIGTFVWLGLWFLGVPLAGVLAVLSALLGFVPIVGPIVAAVPAVLIGASLGLDTAAWVVGLYLVLHVVEGDILTPLIQARAVSLPPGLLLLSQLVLGTASGLIGIAVAAPLAAIGLVVVRRGYVQGWLGKERSAGPAP